MWRSRTLAGVRCAHFPSVITTIMGHIPTTVVETVEQTCVEYHVAEPEQTALARKNLATLNCFIMFSICLQYRGI
jgi:hypothetical protein